MTFDYRRTIAEVGVVCVGRGRYKRRQKGNCCKRLRGEGEGEEEEEEEVKEVYSE